MENADNSFRLLQEKIKQLHEKPPSVRSAIRTDEIFSLLAEQLDNLQRSANYIQQLDLLREIANRLVELRDLEQLARHILEGANRLIAFTDGAIGLVNEGIIKFPFAIGKSSDSVRKFEIPVGEGITGWVVKNKTHQKIDDTALDSRYHGQITSTKSELDVPIIYGGESIGLINVESDYVNAFTEDDVRLLTALAQHAAIALKNAQLFSQIEARTKIIERLTSSLEFRDVLELVLDTIFGLIRCTEASVGIVEKENNVLRFTIAKGESKRDVEEFVMSIDKGLNGWVVRNNESARVGDVSKDPRYEAQISTTKSELDVPMVFAGEVIGVLNVESPHLNAFTEEDEAFLKGLAPYAALALRNAGIHEEVKARLEVERERHTAAETMAAIGDLAGNLVHRMNNNVGAIRVRAKQIRKLGESESVLNRADVIEKLAGRVLNEVKEFRERFKDAEASPLDINRLLHDAVREVPIPERITVIEDFDKNLEKFSAAEVHLKEVFRNLVANAVESMNSEGRLSIKTQQIGTKIIVKISDTGSGISFEDQSQVFDRGFSTKEEGKGLGYGLWWVKQYLARNGCDITIDETKVGVGSTFLVSLPIR